jgi:16S rRNA (uracil1498-N3)-methyltransferase
MESVIEKAVELGVTCIHPFFSEFSFVRSQSSLPDSKIDRWGKIVVSATQQCGRGDLMVISKTAPMDKLLEQFNQRSNKLGLFAYEGRGEKTIKESLARTEINQKPEEIWIFVGSEGGFSTTEVQRFGDLGMAPITLGEQVLRVETACIALVSVLKYEFDLMG